MARTGGEGEVNLLDSLDDIINPATEETLLSVVGEFAKKITVIGTTTYIAAAPIGSLQSSAVWQVKKIAVSGSDTIITWADGNNNFDNIATDLTILNYT